MNRNARRQLAEETVAIATIGEYRSSSGRQVSIKQDVEACLVETQLFAPNQLRRLLGAGVPGSADAASFGVRNETTLAAARRLAVDQRRRDVLCLNFASAKNPGGGFLGGSQAQEESLARSSALYASLMQAFDYYTINRNCGTAFYTDHMILSPNVPVFRSDEGDLLDEPYNVSFLTAPAVNAGAVRKNERHREDEIVPVMRQRIEMVLAVAATQGYDSLVLGAWGCGVFRNDPAEIARLFADHLLEGGRYAGAFNHVAFAVLDRDDRGIIGPFESAFGNEVVK